VGLRDQINEKPAIASAVVIGVILLLIGMIALQLRGNHPPTGPSGMQSYYTADDGRTWFADAEEQIPPFQHDGSLAVRCYVFKTDDSAPFAGYLEQYTSKMHDELTGIVKTTGPIFSESGTMVKRPGDKSWIPLGTPVGQQIVHVKNPHGSAEPPQPVYP